MDIKKITLALLLLFVSVGCASPSTSATPSPAPTLLMFTTPIPSATTTPSPTPIPSPTPTYFRTPFITLDVMQFYPSSEGESFQPEYSTVGQPFTANFEVIQAAGYLDRYGLQRTIIQIRNDRDDSLMISRMNLNFYNAGGEVISTQEYGSQLGPIPADSLFLLEIEGGMPIWSELIIEAECMAISVTEFIETLEAHTVSGSAFGGFFTFVGRVANLSETRIDILEVRAVLYNSEGGLIGFGAYTSLDFSYRPLGPGGTMSFGMHGEYDPNSEIDSYELFMYGY